jgi:hypothetical protein
MNAKLFLQILLTLGCVALAIGAFEGTVGLGRPRILSPVGWWRGAMACWMLIVAVRMVYPARAN